MIKGETGRIGSQAFRRVEKSKLPIGHLPIPTCHQSLLQDSISIVKHFKESESGTIRRSTFQVTSSSHYHDLCLDFVENGISSFVFGLQFPVIWLESVSVFKSSHSQSLYHGLSLDSVVSGFSGFHHRFTIFRSLISRYLA